MFFNLYKIDNMKFEPKEQAEYIYSDCIYENKDLSWIEYYWEFVKEGGVFTVQTDWHSVFEIGVALKSLPGAKFVNHLTWKNEWGNHPKDRFHQCFDDIIIISKGKHKKFDSSVIQVSKATKNTGLNPSGRETKTATAFVDDICLTTTSKERIKRSDGHLLKWQKPINLFARIVAPFTSEGDLVIDNFAGSASLGVWCIRNRRNYIGIENSEESFGLAYERLMLEANKVNNMA